MKNEYKNNSKKSCLIILMYRSCNLLYKKGFDSIARILDILWGFFRWFFRVDAQINYKCSIGKNVRFPHEAQGVIISRYAVIGDNVIIYHGVTIGINERKVEKYVVIGDNSFIGAGAKVINCKVGHNCSIGANAVAYKDVSDNSIVLCDSTVISKNKY